jgi:cytoskeletal protein CcmA (bactofilin family)
MGKQGRIAKSIVRVGAAVTGNVDTDAPVQIDGTIEGDVRGTLVEISRGAIVKGSIFAEAVHVAGTVNGGIRATSVTLTRDARLEGEVSCESLQIESGADIEAQFNMSAHETTIEPEETEVD